MVARHSGSCGDIIWSLPALKDLMERRGGRSCHLYLHANVPAHYPHGHPGGNYILSEAYARSLLPLLQAQPWIATADLWTGQPYDLDLDLFRRPGFNLAAFDIAKYQQLAYFCSPNLHDKWLTVPRQKNLHRPLLVCRTWRYRNPEISYHFLRNYKNVFYIGSPEEYATFKDQCPIPHHPTANFLQLAQVVQNCRGIVCNQTAVAAIADGLKVPRVLELCPATPNVQWHGPGGYEAFQQETFEAATKEMMGDAVI